MQRALMLAVLLPLTLPACSDGRAALVAPATPSVLSPNLLGADTMLVPDADGWMYSPVLPGTVEYSRRVMQGRMVNGGCELSSSYTPPPGDTTTVHESWEAAINVRTCAWIEVTGRTPEQPMPEGMISDTDFVTSAEAGN